MCIYINIYIYMYYVIYIYTEITYIYTYIYIYVYIQKLCVYIYILWQIPKNRTHQMYEIKFDHFHQKCRSYPQGRSPIFPWLVGERLSPKGETTMIPLYCIIVIVRFCNVYIILLSYYIITIMILQCF